MDIFEAIKTKNLTAVQTLIKADPKVVDAISPVLVNTTGPAPYPQGIRPLMWATFVLRDPKDVEIASALLVGMKAINANLNEIDIFSGRTALHWAAHNDNTLVLKAIQEHAYTPLHYNKRDNGNKTPTQIALSKGFRDFAKAMASQRLRNAGKGPVHLAVVGMGATGSALFIRLVRGIVESPAVFAPDSIKNFHFSLIDSKPELGRGMAYSDELNAPTSILNVPAAGMSIDGTEPNDFVHYVKDLYLQGDLEQELGEAGQLRLTPVGPPSPSGYYPRTFFGKYVSRRLSHWIEVARSAGMTVDVHAKTVVTDISKPTEAGVLLQLKASDFGDKPGAVLGTVQATHVFYATGHWDHKKKAPKPYETHPGSIQYPANRQALSNKGIFKKPTHVAVMGSSLSAIDAVFGILLHPDVGTLEWVGDQPIYHPKGTTPWRVTCYSKRGAWPKVRPSDNRDIDAQWTSPGAYEIVRQIWNQDKGISLDTMIQLLDNEMALAYKRPLPGAGAKPGEKPPLPSVIELFEPLKLIPAGEPRDPWPLTATDVRDSDDGDLASSPERPWVRWYQVIHNLFYVMSRAYRGFTPQDRERFDKEFNTPFLWAFAPMPLHSARILLAMHQAGVLNLYRTPDMFPGVNDKHQIEYRYLDEHDKVCVATHDFLAVVTGLGSDVRLDAAELTINQIQAGEFALFDRSVDGAYPENTVFLADDDSYEFIDTKGNQAPVRRGVGFFTHGSVFAIQAVPAVVHHSRNAAEVYLGEFAARLFGPEKAIPAQKAKL